MGELLPLHPLGRDDPISFQRRGGPSPRLTNSATTQVHILGLELAYPTIFPIHDLLESMKGLVLLKDSCRISKTWDSSRVPARSSGEGSVMMVFQRPWTRPMTQ